MGVAIVGGLCTSRRVEVGARSMALVAGAMVSLVNGMSAVTPFKVWQVRSGRHFAVYGEGRHGL